jgi:branched-chain amino acid transport system ATP-binding protein
MLNIDSIVAGYSSVPVLDRVSIHVGEGEFVSVVGPNGAGKSTLFKTISGVVKPMSGSITFEGIDLLSVPASKRPHLGIAHVPEGRQVFPSLTVLENLEMGSYTQAGQAAWKTNIDQIHTLFPVLAERSDQLAGTLSGGEQQMLAIGRALMGRPQLLLLDEPSMGLAPLMVQKVFEVIRAVAAQGVTILLVEQNARLALELCSRGYVMESGCITLADTAAILAADPRVRAAYLGE